MKQALVMSVAMSLLLAFGIGAARSAAPALPQNVEFVATLGAFSKYRLKSNGMPIYLSRNDAAPVITFMVVYHVGSRNEGPGNTGSAHLLEHLLATKSTINFGPANGHKSIPDLLYAAGAGADSNMTTWYDRMNGYSTLPSGRLELAMKIEADRLGRGLILDRERQAEMSVVRNEYEIGENDPAEVLLKAVVGAAIVAHPYHWDTIGYRSDIEGVSTDKLREHYKAYFWPNNAEAILVGDFQVEKALAMFDREFGAFARSTKPIPQVVTGEPPQEGERRVIIKRPGGAGIVQAAYIRPGAQDPDFIALDVLSTILTQSLNSRLYQALVETQIASSVGSTNHALRDPFVLLIQTTVARSSSHQKAEDALKAALQEVASNGVREEEVKRAQKQIEVRVIRSRDGTFNLASSLGEALASANWEWWHDYVDAVNKVTTDDVRRVAAKYLIPEHATIGWFIPAESKERQLTARGSTTIGAPTPPAARGVADRAGARKATPNAANSRAVAARDAAPSPFAKRALRRVLQNGMTLIVVENHAVPTVALQATILAGTVTVPVDKPALALLTADVLDRGTITKSKLAIAEALDAVGAQLDVNGGFLETTATGSGLSRDTKLLLETLADQLKNPAFAAEEIEHAKAERRAVVMRNAQDTGRRALDRIRNIIYPRGHPHRAPTTEEMLASLDSLTREELSRFHRQRYNGSSLILAIAGDVAAGEVASMVEELFGDMPRGERPASNWPRTPPGTPVSDVVTMRGKANINFIFGAASGLARHDPDYEASLIANAAVGQDALSSRIGKRVRGVEGLSYSLASRFQITDVLDGIWTVDVAVAPANLQKALISTREEFEKYCREGINDEELAVQKQHFAGSYQVKLGANTGIVAALADAERYGYGPGYLDEYPERFRRLTREQVNAAINSHLHPDKLNLVIAGDLDHVP
jgi:zinc protease